MQMLLVFACFHIVQKLALDFLESLRDDLLDFKKFLPLKIRIFPKVVEGKGQSAFTIYLYNSG